VVLSYCNNKNMKTIIVSNRLPVKVLQDGEQFEFQPSEGGLATGLGSIYQQGNNVWIGWPGLEPEEEQQPEIKRRLAELNLLPVFLTQEEINLYYEGFSNETLWPVFHYFPSYAHFEQHYWDSYQVVNEKFKAAILKILEPGDTLWIHDYQLLLLPGMIREEMPDITIGFFLHIPFPSLEIFRLIPWRTDLLEGMLGADLIGVHTFDDARHFISSATRLLPVQASSNILIYNNRVTAVEPFPMGIDSGKFEQLPGSEEVQHEIALLRESFGDVKMILSIDRLDYSKGILERLQAFELLLQENPEYIEKVVLYMIVVPSRDNVPRYSELHDEIDMLTGNINARYRTLNWLPIHYYYRSFPVETLSALYSTADVCLVSPMRDGMNLVCKEYVASRTDDSGVLILSELAGAAKELADAIIVNPNNIGEIYRAIMEALKMPLDEQQRRMKAMRQIVRKFNVKHWVKIYMDRLYEVKEMQNSMQTKYAGAAIKEQITAKYTASSKRIILLDYDGTLVGFNVNIEMAFPDEELLGIIRSLTDDPRNHVVIISGRNYETLEKWFGTLPLDMIAEHGVWQKKQNSAWVKQPGLTSIWKQEVYPVLETFTDRTPGSFIEEKSFSLVWHYRKVERGLGELRATELMNNLRYLTADKGLQLMPGNKIIEIKNIEVNKGKAALTFFEGQDYDFIMAMGDDHTDEDIFKVLPEKAVSIKIGSDISAANYYLNNFREVRALLHSLINKDAVRL